MALASAWGHEFDTALSDAQAAIDLGTDGRTRPPLAAAYFVRGQVYCVTGRLELSQEESARALAASRAEGDPVHQSLSSFLLGFLANFRGEYTDASQLQSEGLQIARQHNFLVPLIVNLFAHGLTLTGKGEYENARTTLEEGRSLALKAGAEVWFQRILNSLGWLHAELGDVDAAIALNRESADGARKRGDPETIANAEINLGEVFLSKGDHALAQECLDRVHHLVHDAATSEWMRWRYSTHLFAALGELCLARGNPTRAQDFADRCVTLAAHHNSRKYLVRGWRLKGEIALARHERTEAEEALRQALTIARAIGNPTQHWKTHLALGRLHDAAKRSELAHEEYQAARRVIDRILRDLQTPELRASLQASPLVLEISDLSRPR
jgi:tetratricopeptide (TPR) repeat protein